MLIILENIRKFENRLSELREKKRIFDYRLILKLNMSVNLYIVTDNMTDVEIQAITRAQPIDIDTEIISNKEFETDDYYKNLFENTRRFDLGLRRSLSNIIEYNDDIEFESCPIVSFYSHKGGVGRTTALALFASYYAMHHGKKVFIIDCDFEAPGLINFYGISNDELPKSGIVEYINDKEAGFDIRLRDNYVYDISKSYSGDGEINMLPAGNIFDDSDRSDYLEALARLDIHSTSTIVRQFQDVINDINREFKPDVILIDSRTGFNDLFGIVGNKLANIILGFFGNNTQNRPGLHFFLNTLLRKTRKLDLILILSILPSSFKKELKSFQDETDSYIQNNIGDDLESLPALPVFSLSRYPALEKIGTIDEDPEDFVTLVERQMLSDYNQLFVQLARQVSDFSEDKTTDLQTDATPELIIDQANQNKDATEKEYKKPEKLKKEILRRLSDNFPEPYAEHIQFTDVFLNSGFYFRKCMEDIFNHDKFILLGGKGTGKTAFYRALREEDFFNRLQTRSQKHKVRYRIVDIVSLENDHEKNKYIDIATFNRSQIEDPEYFYKRFWHVYIRNAIRLDDHKTGFKSESGPEVRPIRNDSATAIYFRQSIYKEDLFNQIEEELYKIDVFLKKNDQYLIITFDQLDKVVKPVLWAEAVSPLIRFCITHNFERILPKLFLRRDLFNKLGNLTNKQSLEKRSINLEWTREEMYSFFFKVIFANLEKEFFEYIKLIGSTDQVLAKKIEQKLHKKNSYNQLHPEQYLLKPLVQTFFQKNAGRFGETYDWIYKNLKNADGTISLRPFLDLIKYAIDKQYEKPDLNNGKYPILAHKCFTYDVRKKAVKRHFEDMANEEGNEILLTVINDIKDDKIPKKLKISPLPEDVFHKLMKTIIARHEELKNRSIIELEESLKLNGIISVRYSPGGIKEYTFAYLYKYYLGLLSPGKRRAKVRP